MAREMHTGAPREGSNPPAYDFTNVFGDRGRAPTTGDDGGEDGGERRMRRRARDGSITGGGASSAAAPTVEVHMVAMLRALETQGRTTTHTLSTVLSRLDSVETRNQEHNFGGPTAASTGPTAQGATGSQIPEGSQGPLSGPPSPPRGGTSHPLQQPDPAVYQTPPGLRQAAATGGAWDPFGPGFQFGSLPGNLPGGMVPPPPPPYQGQVPPWIGYPGPSQSQDDGSGRGIDVKSIPQVPDCKWSTWKTRRDEIQGFWAWIEALCSWLGLLQPIYVPEMKEVLERDVSLTSDLLSPPQMARSSRLFYLLKSAFAGNKRVESIIRIFELQQNVGSANGYELVRLFRREFSVRSRTEALQFRQEFLDMKVWKSESPVEIMTAIESKYLQFRQLLLSCPYPRMISDVDIPESAIYLLILRSMPSSVEQYLRFHCGETVMDLKKGIEFIQSRQLITGDRSRASVLKEDQEGGKGDWFWYGKGKNEKGKCKGKGKEEKGKSKGKGKSDRGKGGKGKGKGKSKSRESSNDSKKGKGKGKGKDKQALQPNVDKEKAKKEGLCFKCGRPGHQAKDCWVKGGQARSLESEEEGHEGSEPEKEIFAVFRHFTLDGSVSENASKVHVKSMVQGDRELRGSGSAECGVVASERVSDLPETGQREICDRVGSDVSKWLIDSGATSHIVASRFLSSYQVVREHNHSRVEPRAANDEVIPVVGLVDLAVYFPLPKGKKQKVTLTKVFICDIGMNVLSTFVLASNGWKTSLSLDSSCLVREGLMCPLSVEDRAWWLFAKDPKRPVTPKKPKGDAMDVGKVEDKPGISKAVFGSILKKDVQGPPETYRHEPSGLTFLLRAVRTLPSSSTSSEAVGTSDLDVFHECVEWHDLSQNDLEDNDVAFEHEPVSSELQLEPIFETSPTVPFSVRDVLVEGDLSEEVNWRIYKREDGHHVVIETETISTGDDKPVGVAEDVEIDIPLESPSLYDHLAQGMFLVRMFAKRARELAVGPCTALETFQRSL